MQRPLLQDLPEYLRDDPATHDLLKAFERLLIGGADDLSNVLEPHANPRGLEDLLDDLPRYFTPGSSELDGTPDAFLPWLSQWVALSLRTDITYGENKNPARENQLRRNFIAELADIYRHRGTRLSMQRLLGVFTARREMKDGKLVVTPREVLINDQVERQPHYFVIQLNLEDVKGGSSIDDFERVKELADSVIRLEKPAHTRYLLQPIFVTMRIGQRAAPPMPPPGRQLPTRDFIRLGENTRLGAVPRDSKSAWGA